MSPNQQNNHISPSPEDVIVPVASAEQPQAQADVVSKPSRRKRWLLKIAMGVLVILVGLAIGVGSVVFQGKAEMKSAKKVSDAFIQDLVANNPQGAYQLTGPQFRQVTTESQLATFANTANVKITVQPYQENSWQITFVNGSTKSVITRYVLTNPRHKLLLTVTLYKIGDKWLVEGVHSEVQK